MKLRTYDDDPRRCSAETIVKACLPVKEGFAVVCENTCFFPGGGGQECDTGTINGSRVKRVYGGNDGIYHVTDQPFKTGESVTLKIDAEKRLADIEVHTGEHILSGKALGLFGARNVGFHIGKDYATADFDIDMNENQTELLEREVNKVIRGNFDVIISYPSKDELDRLPLRKRPETDEEIRVVAIEGTDMCACCGTHAARTGEVGLLKIISAERWKGGTRITFLCGGKAENDYRLKDRHLAEIARIFSTKPDKAADLVRKILEANKKLKADLTETVKKYAYLTAEKLYISAPVVNGEKHIKIENSDFYAPDVLCEALLSFGKCSVFITFGGKYILAKSSDSYYDIVTAKEDLKKSGAKGGGKENYFSGKL